MTNKFKGVFALNAEGFLENPDQRALLAPATRRDSYETDAGRLGSGYSDWEHGRSVASFNIGQMYPIAVGDILEIKSIATGQPVAHGEVQSITMVDSERLNDAELRELGFKDKATYLARTEGGLKRRGWFVRVMLLESD